MFVMTSSEGRSEPAIKGSRPNARIPNLAREYAEQKVPRQSPLSEKLNAEPVQTGPPPPTGRKGKKIVVGVGVALGTALVGGALFMLDPYGLVTEKKLLSPAPKRRDKDEGVVTNLVADNVDKVLSSSTQKQLHANGNTNMEPTTSQTSTKIDATARKSSITSLAEDSVQLLVSGKRTLEEEVLKDKHERQMKLAQQEKEVQQLKAEMEKEKRQKAEAELQNLYEKTKLDRNKELENVLCQDMSDALEQAQSAVLVNRQAGATREEQARLLKMAMDADKESVAQEFWPKIGELRKHSLEKTANAETITQTVDKQLEGIFDIIREARADEMMSSNPSLNSYEDQAKSLALELHKSVEERERVLPSRDVMKHYYKNLQAELHTFEKELENLPDFKPGKTGDRFNSEELSELVLFAHRRVYQLKKQLREQECMEDHRLQEILEGQRDAFDIESKKRLNHELASQKLKFKQALDAEVLAEQCEQKTREELTRQGLAKSNHANDMLVLQGEQLTADHKKRVEQSAKHEQEALKESLAESLAIYNKLDAIARMRADVNKVVSNLQQLVSNAKYLELTVAHPGSPDEEAYKLVGIGEAVARCKDSSPDDPFVQSVLGAIPSQALADGVYTLTSLENRFSNVYNECRKDALFPNSNNVLSSSLSRVYGKLLLFTVNPRYDNVADFYKDGIEGMDTKGLLVQANYFMDKRHVAEAVKCMVQLKGLPRRLAQDWIREAQMYLEVQQASDALSHYALSQAFSQIL